MAAVAPDPADPAVDAYLAGFSDEIRERLDGVRSRIHEASPGTAEGIRYGMAALTPHRAARNTVRFLHAQPMPWELVERLVAFLVTRPAV